MSDNPFPKKSEALIRVRETLTQCPRCRTPVDHIEANSHTVGDRTRFYFQFLHGGKECIDFTYADEFEGWLAAAAERSG